VPSDERTQGAKRDAGARADLEQQVDEYLERGGKVTGCPTGEQHGISPKKVRGMSKGTIDLIKAMRVEAEKAQPITGRGIGYKLFVRGLIGSMGTADMKTVYRCLKIARERGMIPWEWIVDESRALEVGLSWDSLHDYMDDMVESYCRDYWNEQPVRVQLWTEKGTVRGVCGPVLSKYGVGFRNVHGFNSATIVHDVAQDDDGRPLIILYVGDYDPSGLCMSETDLPNRLREYGGTHIQLKRITLLPQHTVELGEQLSFPAEDKRKDTRYPWFVENYGHRCWELDALDPNALRNMLETAILELIDQAAWDECKEAEEDERVAIKDMVRQWKANGGTEWGWREAQ